MTINQSNYEAFILDYLEGTISPEDEKALLDFLDVHPELKADLDVPVGLVLPSAWERKPLDKDRLKKHPADLYGLKALDYLHIKELEEGLTSDEALELQLLQPDKAMQQADRQAYAGTILSPDNQTSFRHKTRLKRVIFWPALRNHQLKQMAAVAVIALMAAVYWYIPEPFMHQAGNNIARSGQQQSIDADQQLAAEPKVFEKSLAVEPPPTKKELIEIARDPLGQKNNDDKESGEPETTKNQKSLNTSPKKVNESEPPQNIKARRMPEPRVDTHKPINAYELALNVMMPQYMQNNILSRELDDMYIQLQADAEPPKNMALLESGVKVLNFFSKDNVKLNRYYDDHGNLIGYHVSGNGLNIKRRSK